jgi:hypothetical protein
MLTGIPLLVRSVIEWTPLDYFNYIKGLHQAPKVRPQKAPVSLTFTKKGAPSVKVTGRKPPYVMQSEFLALCREHKVRQNVLFLHLKKRKIKLTSGVEVKLTLGKN